ncbi:MAG: hypothetical protein A2081_03075 [Elusimicrobia bacterium GWC2_61_19]|nr:MAG: hypothetical protein A2081_03075 [Elusimicrobia bacterium GWC2_61_19]
MKLITAIIIALFSAANAAASGPGYTRAAGLLAASEKFLGVKYVLGPLGEGPDAEFDRGPLMSYTGLDCTTFVEETMAFALGGEAGAPDLLRRIRYQDGLISYRTRNHFTELDWLPNNIAAGFLEDITAGVAGANTRTVRKIISKRAWYAAKTAAELHGFETEPPAQHAARLNRLRALGAAMPDQAAAINYVPLEAVFALLDRIPSGTVVALVREDRPDEPSLVSHQFFIFDGPSGKIIRHAAFGKMVLDVPAADYLAGLANAGWRVLGLNLSSVK